MPRKLKTFVTESGFFELAVAAPSMKAALAAWGITVNLFQQGLARQTDDPAIVAAAQSAPGRVLRRAIGSKGAFSAEAELPKVKGRSGKAQSKIKARKLQDVNRAARDALERAQERHRKKMAALDKEREALEARAKQEEREWRREEERLEDSINRLK